SDNAGLAVSYDHDNLPIKTTRGSATINLYYGPDNQRTREVGSDGTKVYLDDGYEDWISAGSTKVYVGTEAEITNNGSTRSVNYLLTDRLGSVDSIADGTGTLIETRGSDAFGKPRSGTWADLSPPQLQSTSITARGFTEHEHLNSVQLIHMNGRVYDYQIGRFLSVDPIIQAPLNSQSLNPYSYIMNNPLSGTDPTGYACESTDDGVSDCSTGDHTITDPNTGKQFTLRVTDNQSAGSEAATGTHITNGGPTVEGNGPGMGGTAGFGYTMQVADHGNGAQAQTVTDAKTPSSIPTDTAASAISNPQASDKSTEGSLLTGNGSPGNTQQGTSGKGVPWQVEILYDSIGTSHISFYDFYYQIEDADGNPLTDNYQVNEHVDPPPTQNSTDQKTWPTAVGGRIHDHVGFPEGQTWSEADNGTDNKRIQGFTVRDPSGHETELNTKLLQEDCFNGGHFCNNVTYASGAPKSP
ncbi:MAG TPA: RHS repeat-associated core domain-containing protein, partial [Xanthomonadaceae bacterium]|nr:RHS repeat-associated core domain-containing protein [Xanthomonadaceae bacterium]